MLKIEHPNIIGRRRFLKQTALGTTAFWTVSGAFAEALTLTPRQTEGPLYPDHLPLDTDNDLLRINDTITPAVGEVTHLSGKILDHKGDPIRNAIVELWQVDNQGVYIHSQTAKSSKRDKRALEGSSPEVRVSITSGQSNRLRTEAGRNTFILP